MPLLETIGSGSARGFGLNSESPYIIPNIVSSGLQLYIDLAAKTSYPGSGTTVFDLSGNNRNGTLVNSPTYSNSNLGIISFNGTGQRIEFGNLPITTSAMSMQMFVRVTANAGSYQGLAGSVGSGPDYSSGFNWDQGPVSTAAFNQLGYEGVLRPGWVNHKTTSTPFGQWVNVAFTVASGGTFLYYQNGVQDGSMALTGSGNIGMNDFVLATRPYNKTTNSLNGSIGSAMLYNRVLSASEIQSNFNVTKARFGL